MPLVLSSTLMVQMSRSCADRSELCTNAERPCHRDRQIAVVHESSNSVNWHKDIIKVSLSLTTNTVKRHEGDFEQNALITGVLAPVANVTCLCSVKITNVALCSITSKYEITAVNCLISTYKQTRQTLFQRVCLCFVG